jgi:hypothetical protein
MSRLLTKENPHKEHEGQQRLLVSIAFRKRRMGYGREIDGDLKPKTHASMLGFVTDSEFNRVADPRKWSK